ALIVLGERQIGDRQFAGQRHDFFRFGEQQRRVGHAGGLELLDDLLVGDPRVFLDLIEGQELVPRRGHVLVGGEDRDQRAERQVALDDQIAAQRIEEEWRQLPQKIVQKFGEEFALVDLEPDVINDTQNMGKIGQLKLDRVI